MTHDDLHGATTRRTFLGASARMTALAATGLAAPGLLAAGPTSGRGASADTPAAPRRERVRFASGGSHVAADVYLPAAYEPGRRYPAVAVGGSLTSVKEMMAGRYARELADRGLVALALDYRHYGESGGQPRQYEHPETKADDLSAALAYLAGRTDVRTDGLGLLGVCTSGGTVLYAAARDPRVRAVATVAGWFVEPSVAPALYGGPEAAARHRAEGRAARARYERTGESPEVLCYHNTVRSAAHVGPMEYYMDDTRGGGVPQWRNAFAVQSWEPWLDFDPVREAPRVTAPTLIVHSDGSALPEQARKVYGLLGGPKALHWATGQHFDFYDQPPQVREAADAVAAHFRRHLA